ncbi:hypothetical protein COV20_01355 [Candidatus Woesearchaeota archaeon CG10_big_fil_rev_8_21_14_0_10_45_16]|nr:MAG: hypothetical protein COV20_01355 [Candidatus Woesearchaeota archaeon CG10_big_fil_rev_8_21_14_0_10_45_16]
MGIKIAIIILLLLSGVVIGQEESYTSEQPERWNYDDQTFYDQIDYSQWDWSQINGCSSCIDNALGALEKKGVLQGGNFYDETAASQFYHSSAFSQFLATLPDDKVEKIDAKLIIEAGDGKLLEEKHIRANIDEVPDLKELDSSQFNDYMESDFGVKSVDLSHCQKNSCILQEGTLKNRGPEAENLPLEDVKLSNSKIIMTPEGRIIVKADTETISNYEFSSSPGAKYTVAIINDNRHFTLLSDGHDVGAAQTGIFQFDDGKVFIEPETTAIIDGLGTIEIKKGQKVELSPKPLDKASFENKIYVGEKAIEMTGQGYAVLYEDTIEHITDNTRNGYRLVMSPKANERIESPSKISYNKETRQMIIAGDAQIINGNNQIAVQQGHFLSELRGPKGIISEDTQTYNLYDLAMSLEDSDKSLVFDNNKISTKNSAFYSLQYNEGPAGFVNSGLVIDRITDLGRGEVQDPDIVVISPRHLGIDVETKQWQRYEDFWLKNSQDNPTFIVNFDQQTYSAPQFGLDDNGRPVTVKGSNEVFMEQLLEKRRSQTFGKQTQIYFMGHSGYDGEKREYSFDVNNDKINDIEKKYGDEITSAFGNPVSLKNNKPSVIIPENQLGGHDVHDPVIAGCASADFLEREELNFEGQGDLFTAYLVSQAKYGVDNWQDFIQKVRDKQIIWPDTKTCQSSLQYLSGVTIITPQEVEDLRTKC